jgi:hypothetical protein
LGQELDKGNIADQNYVWLADWLRTNINLNHTLPLDYDTYKKLTTHIAKALAPLLQIWLFASVQDGRFEKRYDELCQLLNIKQYRAPSDIKRKLGLSLDEFVFHGVLSQWKLEKTADRESFKIVFYHGKNFRTDRRKNISAAGENTSPQPPAARRPRQRPLNLQSAAEPPASAIIDYHQVAELAKRGVEETAARKLVADLPVGYPLLATLEWADEQIARQPGKFNNPPGFYISLLQARTTPPPAFRSSAARKAQEEAFLQQQQARQKQAQRRQAEEEARDQEASRQLAQMEATDHDRWQALYNQAKEELFNNPIMARRKNQPAAWHDDTIRSRMKKLLPTNPPAGQADRLPEPARLEPRPFDLQALLTSLRLPVPDLTAPDTELPRPTAEEPHIVSAGT